MPSNARLRFDNSIKDIDNLIDLYQGMEALNEADGKGIPEGIDVLFRSAVVLMISHWEAYVEDITSEALEHLVKHVSAPTKLPVEVRKLIAVELKKESHELAVWQLAGEGWKEVLKKRMAPMKEARNKSFNTPKSQQTSEFIQKALGIDDVRKVWTFDKKSSAENSKRLDSLVEVRGQIAHRGHVTQKVNLAYVRENLELVSNLAGKTGGRINYLLDMQTGKPLYESNK